MSKEISREEIPKHIKEIKKEDRHEIYEKVKSGEIKHKQIEASINNLKPFNQMSEEEAYKIRRKGWEAMQKIKGERKTAKESLEQFLPLFAENIADDENIPQEIKDLIKDNKEIKVTQYDLIMLSMINQARQGSVKAAEYIRDTYGDRPIKESHTINETISVSDKALIDKIANRLNIIDSDYKEVEDN